MFLFPVHLSTLALTIMKKGKDIPGLADTTVPRRLGPKRASNIHKLFVVKRPLREKGRRLSWGIKNPAFD